MSKNLFLTLLRGLTGSQVYVAWGVGSWLEASALQTLAALGKQGKVKRVVLTFSGSPPARCVARVFVAGGFSPLELGQAGLTCAPSPAEAIRVASAAGVELALAFGERSRAAHTLVDLLRCDAPSLQPLLCTTAPLTTVLDHLTKIHAGIEDMTATIASGLLRAYLESIQWHIFQALVAQPAGVASPVENALWPAVHAWRTIIDTAAQMYPPPGDSAWREKLERFQREMLDRADLEE
jgi:hypothetical protein